MTYYSGTTPVTKNPVEKLNKINVLVLDGGAKAAALIKSIFGALGLNNIFIATDGIEGVQIMKEVRIHLIFTDWELKVYQAAANAASSPQDNQKAPAEFAPVSGVKFVERIRLSSMSPNPFIPIIMMMDHASGSEVLQARDCGVNEILLRPIDAEEFCARLVSIIEKPRPFITAKTYKGPCRRRRKVPIPPSFRDRRVCEVKLIRSITR